MIFGERELMEEQETSSNRCSKDFLCLCENDFDA